MRSEFEIGFDGGAQVNNKGHLIREVNNQDSIYLESVSV